MNKRRGFTLIELLVVIAIIAMLLAILMPALGSVKERAKRVVCASNLKQMSIGIATYAATYDDNIPHPLFNDYDGAYSWPAFFAYQINPAATDEDNKITSKPYNLAYLFDSGIITEPKLFYCPSAPKGVDELGVYWQYEDYVGDLAWPFTSDPDRYHANNVRVGYSYIPQGRTREMLSNGEYGYTVVKKMVDLNSRAVMVTDALSTLGALSHKGGMNKPAGVNGLFGDGHASFCNNKEAFDERLWDPSPNTDVINFRTILALLAGNN